VAEPAVTVLLLDCDGVIRHWDVAQFEALAESAGIDALRLAEIAFGDELLAAAMTGAITGEVWADEIGGRAGAAHGCDALEVAAGFLRLGWTIDDAVLAIARQVRAAGNRVAILSNATTRLEADLLSCGVADEVDVVLSSARMGLAKPDAAIYQAAAEALGVAPAACLFIDDQSPNIDAAREVGMHAEVFMGAPALATLARQVGLLG
jgi:putative hydrolase of the HAD superfamily